MFASNTRSRAMRKEVRRTCKSMINTAGRTAMSDGVFLKIVSVSLLVKKNSKVKSSSTLKNESKWRFSLPSSFGMREVLGHSKIAQWIPSNFSDQKKHWRMNAIRQSPGCIGDLFVSQLELCESGSFSSDFPNYQTNRWAADQLGYLLGTVWGLAK